MKINESELIVHIKFPNHNPLLNNFRQKKIVEMCSKILLGQIQHFINNTRAFKDLMYFKDVSRNSKMPLAERKSHCVEIRAAF